MGSGRWDTDAYANTRSLLKSNAVKMGISEDDATFAYSTAAAKNPELGINPNLKPQRINAKPFGKLESRDSKEHPDSNAVLVCFDVTGSNYKNAVTAQKKLPNLMTLLEKYLPDPQVSIAANDDVNFVGERALQISDFESDNRIDNHIRSVFLIGEGGGNNGESYDMALYAAARKTILDCKEKRDRKGYMFLYADEPFFPKLKKQDVKTVFGDTLEVDISIATLIKEVQETYNLYVIWPQNGYIQARDQYVKLLGQEFVLQLENPSMICELIGSVIGLNEEKVTGKDAVNDLVKLGGITEDEAAALVGIAAGARRKIKLPEARTR